MSALDIVLVIVGAGGFLGGLPLLLFFVDAFKTTEATANKQPHEYTEADRVRMALLIVSGFCFLALYVRNPKEGNIIAALALAIGVIWMIRTGRMFDK